MERLPSNQWECKECQDLFTSKNLNEAFVNLRKDPEYIAKGISMAYEKHKHAMEKLAPNDRTSNLLTLPIDSEARKGYPLLSGCLKYFAAALAGVARTSKQGNDKHNPGQPIHHARNKSSDHGDCIIRHLMDVEDMIAANNRATEAGKELPFSKQQLLDEASSLSWRALAYSQELHEKLGAAPLAPGAKE
jgi:hypothetical protein